MRQLAAEGSAALRALGILSVQLEGDTVISLRLVGQEIVLRTESGTFSTKNFHFLLFDLCNLIDQLFYFLFVCSEFQKMHQHSMVKIIIVQQPMILQIYLHACLHRRTISSHSKPYVPGVGKVRAVYRRP